MKSYYPNHLPLKRRMDMSKTAKTLATEAGVWKSLNAATSHLVHWTRIEARIGAGIPDINGAMTDIEFWVELKVVRTVKFLTEGLWRPGQIAWQMRRARVTPGGVWNLVSHPSGQSVKLYRGAKVFDLNTGVTVEPDFETHLPPNWFAMLDYIGRQNGEA